MSFSRNDYEYVRPSAQADWLREFADRELAKGGNFDDIRAMYKESEDKQGVEACVKELRDRIGLDKLLAEKRVKTASVDDPGAEFEEDDPTRPGVQDIGRHQRLMKSVLETYESDPGFKEQLNTEFEAARAAEPKLTFVRYLDRMVTEIVNKRLQQDAGDEEEKLVGGLGDGKPDSDFDKKQLEKGIEVEKEHTPDLAIRKEISKDHLTEHEKYYDFLEEMEGRMEKDKKSKAEIVSVLVSLANALEEDGDTRGAAILDKHIAKIAKEEKDEKKGDEIPEVLEKNPKVKVFLDNLCRSREGHIDFPAILQMLRDERREQIDTDDEGLKSYIKRRLKEEKRDLPDAGDDVAGMGYTIFVVTEGDDGNDEMFHSPAPKR